MEISLRNNTISFSQYKINHLKTSSDFQPRGSLKCSLNLSSDAEGSIARIREMFNKVELSISAYDTAWVAMCPSRESPSQPCFPQCLEWIMENQHQDGSWCLQPSHRQLVKDTLSSTLACLLALRKWRKGERLLQRGLDYIGSNSWAIKDMDQLCPIGFDTIFPNMIKYAKELEMSLPLDPVLVDSILRNGDLQLERIKINKAALAYVAEGLGRSCLWEGVMNQQRSNGSLLNSPASTAAALIHHFDDKCFGYLCSLSEVYRNGVPTIHPANICIQLQMIDRIEMLGLDRFFRHEIERVLDETYRYWQNKNEEIFSDVMCCAMAFRLLRMKGYEISADGLGRFLDQEHFFSNVSLQFHDVATIFELYKASHLTIEENEDNLEKLHAWTSAYLRQQLSNKSIFQYRLRKEVESALKNFYGTLARVMSRQSIELYDKEEFQILKTAYSCPNIANRDLHILSIQHFNDCQVLHQAELQQLERWYKNNRLDHMRIPQQVLYSNYFMITAELSEPELSKARISFVQTCVLVTVVDDLFDNCGSRQELESIMELVKKWENDSVVGCYSEQVEIFILALHNTIDENAELISSQQGRCVKTHLISLWHELLEGMMKELDWWTADNTPTMDEYLSVALTTIASKICIFSAIYFLGPKLSEDVLNSEEIRILCKHVSTVARLFNDFRTYEKELAERKPNIVSIELARGLGDVTMKEVRRKMMAMIESSRRKLLQMVLQTKGSEVPRVCKDLFWSVCKICFYLYKFTNEYDSPKAIINHTKEVIYEPIVAEQ